MKSPGLFFILTPSIFNVVSIFWAVHDISWNFLPSKITPGGGVGQMFLGSINSQINAHMRAKFSRGPTVVSKKRGGADRQIDRHTHKGTLQLYIVDTIRLIHNFLERGSHCISCKQIIVN